MKPDDADRPANPRRTALEQVHRHEPVSRAFLVRETAYITGRDTDTVRAAIEDLKRRGEVYEIDNTFHATDR